MNYILHSKDYKGDYMYFYMPSTFYIIAVRISDISFSLLVWSNQNVSIKMDFLTLKTFPPERQWRLYDSINFFACYRI